MPPEFLDYGELAPLQGNITNPNRIVAISSIRALVRIADLQIPAVRDRIYEEIKGEFRRYKKEDILGVSYLPDQAFRHEISTILDSSDDQDKERAFLVLDNTVDLLMSRRSRLRGMGDEKELQAVESVLNIIRAPASSYLHLVPELETTLFSSKPRLATLLVTSLFAKLATVDFDDRSEWHLVASESASHLAHQLSSKLNPDVPALFQVYQAFFRHSAQFWMDFLESMKRQGWDVVRAMPPFFPITKGPLAVSRQIEWTISRAGLRTVLRGLADSLQSPDPKERWGAAQLTEWVVRNLKETHFPVFGGGSGPDDTASDGLLLFLDKTSGQELEPNRYTDLTIYEGDLYPGDDCKAAVRLRGDSPLVAGAPYTLEVAIRLRRTGIDADRTPLRGVINPRHDNETLTVYILAQALGAGIRIKESFATIQWPYDSDSESAFFRLNVPPPPQVGVTKGTIEVRVYDGSLDLLDIVRLSVAIISDANEVIGNNVPRQSLTWVDDGGGMIYIDPSCPPRLLSIDVGFDPESSKYRLQFKFLKHNKQIVIPGSSNIARGDIERLLVKVRDFWTELVVTNYATELVVTRTTFDKYVTQLWELGREAWSLLFGARYAAQTGASENIGKLLTEMLPNEGSHIQITCSDVDDFIFPWNIVYPAGLDTPSIDPFQFWGARYQIEQVTSGPKSPELTDEPIDLVFTLDPGFGNSGLQKELLDTYKAAAKSKLNVTGPISDQIGLFGELARNPSAHIYYFYCHGYAPSVNSTLRRDGVQLLKQRIEAIPEPSSTRAALETLLALIAKMKDEAWIYVGNSEITESKIKSQRFFEKRRPIVFLNMCQSAELLPSLTSGLVRVFLQHNASVVIGTESPMTSVFANAFAKVFFDGLFTGSDVGTALWKARRHFLQSEMRNPLGLAYTLYGRAVVRLGNSPILAATESQGCNP